MMKTVTALFDTFDQANRAVSDLISGGFNRSEISLLSSNAKQEYNPYFDTEGKYIHSEKVVTSDIDALERNLPSDGVAETVTTGEGAAKGAGIGAALGGLGGVLMGLGLLAIPGVGPALAAGALVSGLVGASIGGLVGGVSGALVNAGVSAEDAEYYTEGVRRGGHLVVVSTPDERSVMAEDILNKHQPINVRERSEVWRQDGWTLGQASLLNSEIDSQHRPVIRE
jgi:hypothetical protein